jgi:O-antigen ligase
MEQHGSQLLKEKFNNLNKFKILNFLLLSIPFLLPIEKTTVRFLMAIFTVVCLIYGDYSQLKIKKNWIKLSIVSLWILPFIQLLLLNRIDEYLNNLITKITLFLIPILILIGYQSKKINLSRILKFFIYGTLSSCLFCLINAVISYYFLKNDNAFTYKSLSLFHHPSYFTMYLNFVVGIIYLNNLKPIKNFKLSINLSLIIVSFLSFFILFASSRTGWITNILLHLFFISCIFYKKKISRKTIIYFLVLMIPFTTVIYTNKTIQSRFNEIINDTFQKMDQKEVRSSTTTRKKIWFSSLKLIKEKWITGYGLGLSKKVFQKQLKKDGYNYLVKKNYNSHNQYLQVFLDQGVFGFLILVFFTFGMLYASLKQKDFIYALFLFVMILNFMTESILETQSGVIFFAFFNTIFFFQWFNKKYLALE